MNEREKIPVHIAVTWANHQERNIMTTSMTTALTNVNRGRQTGLRQKQSEVTEVGLPAQSRRQRHRRQGIKSYRSSASKHVVVRRVCVGMIINK